MGGRCGAPEPRCLLCLFLLALIACHQVRALCGLVPTPASTELACAPCARSCVACLRGWPCAAGPRLLRRFSRQRCERRGPERRGPPAQRRGQRRAWRRAGAARACRERSRPAPAPLGRAGQESARGRACARGGAGRACGRARGRARHRRPPVPERGGARDGGERERGRPELHVCRGLLPQPGRFFCAAWQRPAAGARPGCHHAAPCSSVHRMRCQGNFTGTAAVTQRTRPQSRRDGYCYYRLNAVRLPKV